MYMFNGAKNNNFQ